MKRWDANQMREIGEKLFAKIHRQKYHAHHNHEAHFMARDIDAWLPQGIQAILEGTYDPRCLKRYYFSDEVVDQLHISDRIFQHILLKQLKPTLNIYAEVDLEMKAKALACCELTEEKPRRRNTGNELMKFLNEL